MNLQYFLVDVFSHLPYSGNSLPVFPDASGLSSRQMLRITQEPRHFEAIFLESTDRVNIVRARVFDLFEELPFAGHPLIGAAAVLHRISMRTALQTWRLELPTKAVSISTTQTGYGYTGLLDQGAPEFLGLVTERDRFARAFDLTPDDLHPDLPLEVVSTGLRYLILPVRAGVFERAHIRYDLTRELQGVNAQFAVLFYEAMLEIRHWNKFHRHRTTLIILFLIMTTWGQDILLP